MGLIYALILIALGGICRAIPARLVVSSLVTCVREQGSNLVMVVVRVCPVWMDGWHATGALVRVRDMNNAGIAGWSVHHVGVTALAVGSVVKMVISA